MKDTHTLAMEQFAEASTWLERTGSYAHSMTLRDHFAGLAMQANRARNSQYENWSDLALDAYEMADAMLKERAK